MRVNTAKKRRVSKGMEESFVLEVRRSFEEMNGWVSYYRLSVM